MMKMSTERQQPADTTGQTPPVQPETGKKIKSQSRPIMRVKCEQSCGSAGGDPQRDEGAVPEGEGGADSSRRDPDTAGESTTRRDCFYLWLCHFSFIAKSLTFPPALLPRSLSLLSLFVLSPLQSLSLQTSTGGWGWGV